MNLFFAESNSFAGFLAIFSPKVLQSGCTCSVCPQHESVLGKCHFHHNFFHHVKEQVGEYVARTISSGFLVAN